MKLTLKTPKYSTFLQCGINLFIFYVILTTRDLILFQKIQTMPYLAFEGGLENLSIQKEECKLALILVFLPQYFANSVNKSFLNLAIKGINFDQKSEKISHLGFKMCIKAPKYLDKFISWQLSYFCFLHNNTYEWIVV